MSLSSVEVQICTWSYWYYQTDPHLDRSRYGMVLILARSANSFLCLFFGSVNWWIRYVTAGDYLTFNQVLVLLHWLSSWHWYWAAQAERSIEHLAFSRGSLDHWLSKEAHFTASVNHHKPLLYSKQLSTGWRFLPKNLLRQVLHQRSDSRSPKAISLIVRK